MSWKFDIIYSIIFYFSIRWDYWKLSNSSSYCLQSLYTRMSFFKIMETATKGLASTIKWKEKIIYGLETLIKSMETSIELSEIRTESRDQIILFKVVGTWLEILAHNNCLNFKIRCSPHSKIGSRECLILISGDHRLKSKPKRKIAQIQLKKQKIQNKRRFLSPKNKPKPL